MNPLLGGIVSAVSGITSRVLENRAQKHLDKAAIKKARVEAEITQIEKSAQAETDYDITALRETRFSIKDEISLMVILAPFVGSFLPWTQDYVAQGWKHLNDFAPDWYTWAFLGAISASMGIRWAVTQFKK